MNDEQLNEPTEPTQLQIYSRRIAALKIELAQCKDSRTSWDSVIEQDEKIKKATARIATLEAALQALADEVAVAAAHGIILAINNGALIDAVEALATPIGAKPLKHANWFDGGYLGNGHCSFMWARNGAGACCALAHGHEGPHREAAK